MKRIFLRAAAIACLLLGFSIIPIYAQNDSTGSEAYLTFERLVQTADSLLPYEGRLVLEGKLLALDISDLQNLRREIDAAGDTSLTAAYIALNERFITLMKKIELSMLTVFSQEDWENLRKDYEIEREQNLRQVEALTDSLVIAYSPMFSSQKGKELLGKVENWDKLSADFNYRLGVLYLEQAELRYDRESLKWDELVDSLSRNTDAEIPPEPYKDYSLAIQKFQDILTRFPDSEYSDDALYNLGYIKTQNSDEMVKSEGIAIFRDFIDRFPASPYYPEVRMRLGEYYFNPPLNDMVLAIENYLEVIKYPDNPNFLNALYRLGWSYYRDNKYPEAIDYFTQTVDRTIRQMEAGVYSNLLEESIENLSKSFATDTTDAIRGIVSAVDYLKENPQRLELFGGRMLKRIGDIYQNDMGQYRQAIVAYDTIMTLFPEDAEAPNMWRQKIRCWELLGDKDKMNDEKLGYFQQFNAKSAWVQAQSDTTLLAETNKYCEKYLRDNVRESILASSQTKQKEDYLKAADLCRDYVLYFPNTTETYRINYNLAVILTLNLQDYYPACVENIRVTRNYPPGQYTETCASNAVECAFRLMEKEKSGEITLPPAEELELGVPPSVISAIPGFTAPAPAETTPPPESAPETAPVSEPAQGEPAPEPSTESVPAVPVETLPADTLVEQPPNPQDALQEPEQPSADSSVVEQDTTQLADAAAPAPAENTSPTPLTSAETIYLAAVQNYIELYPAGAKTDVYLLNAGVIFHKHRKFPESRFYLEKLVNEYPQSPKCEEAYKTILDGYFSTNDYANTEKLAKKLVNMGFSAELTELSRSRVAESIYNSAKTLENKQDFMTAGSEYKRVALETPGYKFADNALWESARQFMKAAAWDSAIVSFELLIARAPQSDWADKSINNIAFIYQDNLKDKRKAAENFERIFDRYPKSEFAKNGLSNASVNFTEFEDYNSALRVNEKYLRAYPDAEDAVQVLYDNAELYLKMGNLNKAITSFAEFTKKFPNDPRNIRAEYQVGKYYLEQKDMTRAKTSFERTVKLHKEMTAKGQPGFPRYASFALNKLLEAKFSEYFTLSYNNLNSVAADRTKKETMKKELEESLKELISYRQSEALQSIYNICRLEDDIARAEMNQAVPAKTGEQAWTAREELLTKAVPMYLNAAQIYYAARTEITSWETALSEQKKSLNEKINLFQTLKDTQGFLAPDSQSILDSDKSILKEIDVSLALATLLKDSCTYKIVSIYSKCADEVRLVGSNFYSVPDQGEDRKIKMFFRAGVLGQLVTPRVLNAIDLYRQTWVTADTIKASGDWKDKSLKSAQEIINKFIAEYDELIDRPFERYNINLTAFRQRVKDGDETAYDIVDAPLLYLDFVKAFIDSMGLNTSKIPAMIHKNPRVTAFDTAIDSIYAENIYKYYERYSKLKDDNNKYFKEYDKKFSDTGDDLFYEGMDLFEMSAGYIADYQLELLEYTANLIAESKIATSKGDKLLREMVKKDPLAYGYLVGLSIDGMGLTISGSEQWITTTSAGANFFEASYDVAKWTPAIIGRQPGQTAEPTPVESVTPDSTQIQSAPPNPQDALQEPDTTIVEEQPPDTLIQEEQPVDTSMQEEQPAEIPQAEDLPSEQPVIETPQSEQSSEADTTASNEQAGEEQQPLQITPEEPPAEKPPAENVIPAPVETTPEEPKIDFSAIDALGIPSITTSTPAEKSFYRYTFDLNGIPVTANINISADNKFALYINNKFVGESSGEGDSYLTPAVYSAASFLKQGQNIIAVEVSDPDKTGMGLWFKMDYKLMPSDIENLPIIR